MRFRAWILVCVWVVGAARTTGQIHHQDRPGFFPALQRVAADPIRVDTSVHIGCDSLDATLFLPSCPSPDPLGFPAMIFVHGFGGDKTWDTTNARLWAQSGYVTLCYSVRGHGRSSGLSTIMASRERLDLPVVLDFLGSLPAVNKNRIGMQGGSQGGLHGLWAAADRLQVRAVSADVISPRWASSMLVNGSVRRTLIGMLQVPNVRYAPVRDSLWTSLRTDDFDRLLETFSACRDMDTVQCAHSPIPVLTFSKWQDHFFDPSDAVLWFRRRASPRRAYFGTGGHYTDDDTVELSYQWDLVNAWFNHFVRDVPTDVLTRPEVTYATSSLPAHPPGRFTWTHREISEWPPAGLSTLRLYFRRDSTLSPVPPPSAADSVLLTNAWDSTYSFDQANFANFSGATFNEKLPIDTRSFFSEVLPGEMEWAGFPVLHLHVRSDTDRFPLHARIFEQDAGGVNHLINRVNYVGRHWVPGASGTIEVAGAAQAHRFSAGSRILIELTNIDTEVRDEWGDTPFVVPLFHRSQVSVYTGADRASYIEFPVDGIPSLPVRFASVRATLRAPQKVVIAWTTLSETHNYGFTVERTIDQGVTYAAVGFVPAQGGPLNTQRRDYLFVDSSGSALAWYRVRQRNLDGSCSLSDIVKVDPAATVGACATPFLFGLGQNYPNPFNPSTRIPFSLSHRGHVELTVHDVLGRVVSTVLDDDVDAGTYTAVWNPSQYAAGTYFLRLKAGTSTAVRRLTLLR